MLKKIFSPLSKKFDCKKGQYVNIKSKQIHLFTSRPEDIPSKKSKFYGNIFVKQKFHKPCYQSSLSRCLHITAKKFLTVIYRNKISKIKDSKVAEFNYNLLNNLLYNNNTVRKWKANLNMHCSNCSDIIENTEHLIFGIYLTLL